MKMIKRRSSQLFRAILALFKKVSAKGKGLFFACVLGMGLEINFRKVILGYMMFYEVLFIRLLLSFCSFRQPYITQYNFIKFSKLSHLF